MLIFLLAQLNAKAKIEEDKKKDQLRRRMSQQEIHKTNEINEINNTNKIKNSHIQSPLMQLSPPIDQSDSDDDPYESDTDNSEFIKDMTNYVNEENKKLVNKVHNDIKILRLCHAISKSVRNSIEKMSFWDFGKITEIIPKDSYPINYDHTACTQYKRLLEDFNSKGIRIMGNPPMYSNIKSARSVTVCFYPKSKLIYFKRHWF